MSEKLGKLVAASVSIKYQKCTPDGMGNCEITADVQVVYAGDVTLMNDPIVTVGTAPVTISEPVGAVQDPPGTYTHTFKISAPVACGQRHTIKARATIAVPGKATPVNIPCPS